MVRPLFQRVSNRPLVKVSAKFTWDIDRARYVWLGEPRLGIPGIEVKVCKTPGKLKYRWDKTSEEADRVDIETECKVWLPTEEQNVAVHLLALIEKFIAEAIYDSDPECSPIEVTVSI